MTLTIDLRIKTFNEYSRRVWEKSTFLNSWPKMSKKAFRTVRVTVLKIWHNQWQQLQNWKEANQQWRDIDVDTRPVSIRSCSNISRKTKLLLTNIIKASPLVGLIQTLKHPCYYLFLAKLSCQFISSSKRAKTVNVMQEACLAAGTRIMLNKLVIKQQQIVAVTLIFFHSFYMLAETVQ